MESTLIYSFGDALCSQNSAAFNVAVIWDETAKKLESAKDRLERRNLWIGMAKKYRNMSFSKMITEAEVESTEVYKDMIRMLWRNLCQKMVLHSCVYNLKYFKLMLNKMSMERLVNIRGQWITWSRVLVRNNVTETRRSLWISIVFVLRKRKVVAAHDRFARISIRGEDQWRSVWTSFSKLLVRRKRVAKIETKYNALECLSRFFRRAILKSRINKAAIAVTRFIWNPNTFVRKDVELAKRRIASLARLWLSRKAKRFAEAYADEIFDSAFVHISPNIRGFPRMRH